MNVGCGLGTGRRFQRTDEVRIGAQDLEDLNRVTGPERSGSGFGPCTEIEHGAVLIDHHHLAVALVHRVGDLSVFADEFRGRRGVGLVGGHDLAHHTCHTAGAEEGDHQGSGHGDPAPVGALLQLSLKEIVEHEARNSPEPQSRHEDHDHRDLADSEETSERGAYPDVITAAVDFAVMAVSAAVDIVMSAVELSPTGDEPSEHEQRVNPHDEERCPEDDVVPLEPRVNAIEHVESLLSGKVKPS